MKVGEICSIAAIYYTLMCANNLLSGCLHHVTRYQFTDCLDQVPVVIYELNESAINFISQESFEKALILL